MNKEISLLILAITAIACSRAMFVFFDDPEGPNLLVVMVMAAVIYVLSLAVYLNSRVTLAGLKRLLLAVCVQIVIAACFYFGLS